MSDGKKGNLGSGTRTGMPGSLADENGLRRGRDRRIPKHNHCDTSDDGWLWLRRWRAPSASSTVSPWGATVISRTCQTTGLSTFAKASTEMYLQPADTFTEHSGYGTGTYPQGIDTRWDGADGITWLSLRSWTGWTSPGWTRSSARDRVAGPGISNTTGATSGPVTQSQRRPGV